MCKQSFTWITSKKCTIRTHHALSSTSQYPSVGIWESGWPFFLTCYLTKVIKVLDFQVSRGFVCLVSLSRMLSLLQFYLYLFACGVRTCLRIGVHAHMCSRKPEMSGSCSVTLHRIPLRQDLSLNLAVTKPQ